MEGAQEKVHLIMEYIPQLISRAFLLRIPRPEFLDFVLLSEYLLLNSVSGEKGALRYAKRSRERAGQILACCLNGLGFFSPQDLEPFRQRVLGQVAQWPGRVGALDPEPKQPPKGARGWQASWRKPDRKVY